MLRKLLHELPDNFRGDTVDLRVVITILRVVAGDLEVYCQTHLITDRLHLRVLDRGQRIGDNGKTGKSASHRAVDLLIVQRHLETLVAVLIMHVVDDVQCVDVELTEPCAGLIKTRHYFIVVEVLGCDRISHRADLIAGLLITSAVDRIEQALRKVRASAEELHLLTDTHRGNAACDRIIVTELYTHQLIALILDGRSVDGDFRAVLLKVFRKIRAPEDRHVRLRRRSDILQCVQETVAHLRDHVTSVEADAADRLGDPCRVAGEKLIVSRCS